MAKKIVFKKYKTGNKSGGQRYHIGRKRNMGAYTDAYKGRMIPPFKHMDYMDFKSSPQNYGTAFTRFPYMGKRRYGMGTQEAMMKIVKAKSPEELTNIDIATIPSEEGQKEITKLIREKQRSFGMRPHMEFDPAIAKELYKGIRKITTGEKQMSAEPGVRTQIERNIQKRQRSTKDILAELGIERAD